MALLLVAVHLPAFTRPGHAQEVGLRAGVDLTTVSFDEETSTKPGFGWTAGASVSFGLTARFGVGLEALITRQRTTIEEIVDDSLTYFELPILARWRLTTDTETRRVTIVGGAVLRSLLKAEETVADSTFDISDALESRDVGAALGAEIAISRKLEAVFRYIHSFSGTYKRLDGSADGQHRTFQAGVTYRLR